MGKMATVGLLPPDRGNASGFLQGDTLGKRFHQLFNCQMDEVTNLRKKEKKKMKKKGRGKVKDKKNNKREKSPDRIDVSPPSIELHSNPSSFIVYASVRQAVLERQIKQVSQMYLQANHSRFSDSESDDEVEEKNKDGLLKMPKIVGIGLCGVFELIKETRLSHPTLCARSLQALLDMLQGQQPEGLKSEPAEVIDSLYELLMDLATSTLQGEPRQLGTKSLTSLACACLLSLVIARGDTGKILAAVAGALMSPAVLASQEIKVPGIVTSLQRSVQAVLLGKTYHPDWLSQGIRERARTDTLHVPQLQGAASSESAIASDGRYLYIHNSSGLHKIGSGFGDTIKGHMYLSRPTFHLKDRGWLAYAKGMLFYRRLSDSTGCMTTINPETLLEESKYTLEPRPKGESYGTNVMFSDGEHVGHVAAAKDDSFVVRTFSPICNPMPLVSEIPLKLARKCVDVFGSSTFDPEMEIHTISTGFDEDAVSIAAGKDFALIRSSSGKMLYTGKSQALGIKQGGPAACKWAELPITKSPKIVQYSVGHEGQHALLTAEDGSAFFVGTAKRGEDGDSSLSKGRRQPKPVKPKKLIKLEGKHIISSACNSGTSAVVSRDGEVYMFGKDTMHCDHASGHVSDLKDVVVTSISLGKAHAVALTNMGKVYTFGINNKGQCGRDYIPGGSREMSTNVTMADEEEEGEEDFMCPPGKHRWNQDRCMICTNCGECTGYGTSCVNSDQYDRDVSGNRDCGCGSGDSGCSECGVCRTCAGEVFDAEHEPEAANGGLLEALVRSKEMIQLDLLIGGRQGARNLDQLSRKLEERRNRIKMKAKAKMKSVAGMANGKPSVAAAAAAAAAAASEASNSDYEQDHTKLASLPASRLDVGSVDIPAVQVACGLQHSVVLLENGEVYTFGSNQYGQLGVGDTNIRGVPAKVAVKATIVQVAAGSNHTLLLTSFGQVYSFGSHKKGQLGRFEDVTKDKWRLWFAKPAPVPGIGAKHGRRATWVGASGDQSFLRIDESLINAHTLAKSNIFANQSCIGLIPKGEDGISSITCLMINTKDGSCKSFNGSEQASLYNQGVCLDPVFDVLWSYSPLSQQVQCYNVIHAEARHLQSVNAGLCNILSPELAMSVRVGALATRSHTALHMLGCLDTLTTAQHLSLTVFEEEKEKQATTKVYTKEDFSTVNRFETHGGGWGYSGHSIEAIRFMPDTDVLLGGFGLFGGRGEYFGKIKVFELREEGGENETDGELLAETEEIPYECGAREKYPMLFDEPVLLSANHWYVAWARISGPSSDCGSGGQHSVTTEDQVVFKFKSSKKSNNGTDVNAGQIPQILYRLPAHDSSGVSRKSDLAEPAHILSRDFSRSVSPESFDSLLALLNWSWNTFCAAVSEVTSLKGTSQTAALLDLERLVYISTASLRLSRTYICEVYPSHGVTKKTPQETSRLAECVGDTRALLWKILADSQRHLEICNSNHRSDHRADLSIFRNLANRILDECHQTFVACFHAFYPTGTLKWTCLCDLLAYVEPGQSSLEGCGRLLSAVMEALCHPTVKLSAIMPINCEHETELLLKKQYSTEDNTNNATQSRDACAFPLLVAHMMQRTASESASHWTFREVLDKLLMIVVMPVRQALNQERVTFAPLLVSNTCSLLSAIMSELSASATGSETDVQGTGRPLLTTPNRFTRTSPNAYWNPGNGSPDAICFMVDRPGIVIAGVCVYGGGGQYDYDVELLDDQSEGSSDVSHIGRWNSLEIVKGNFGPEDCVNDIAEVKFDRPVPIKDGVKYALRLRNRGPRTLNGDGGMAKVKCPDGTAFSFSSCSLSSNGTNHTRGQIPQILYYSAPQEGENQLQNSKALAELQARKNAIMVASAVMRSATDLLNRAQGFADERLAKLIGSAQIFSVLLPMVVAYISPVAAIDPRGAVQVLSLVQEVLPPIAQLNSQLCQQVAPPSSPTCVIAAPPLEGSMESSGCQFEVNTTSQHYAIVESDHPYKPATVANYKVTFPPQVKWMSLEFDPGCGTAQVEDSLQLYIPTQRSNASSLFWNSSYNPPVLHTPPKPPPVNANSEQFIAMDTQWWPVLHRFHGTTQWPSMAVVLPGNEVVFSLETASDYVKDDKACFYGFRCTVIGYEWNSSPQEGLAQLEREIACLGGMCAASLMRKDIILPPTSIDELEEDLDCIDEGAQQIFNMHSNLLGKGFALSQAPTINQALEGSLPFCWQSNERAFLKDFVACASGTSGGRLAAWLQPESYLDPKQCDIVYCRDELRCSWPAVITVQTKDQYGQIVHVPNLRVEVKAVPIVKESSSSDESKKQRRLSKYDGSSSILFGGHPPPRLDIPYQVTVKDKKDAFHAICMMKAYENYSFEELRYAAPVVRRPSENMLVRANNDGTYSANWTPGSVGYYNIHVTIDGFETGDGYKVEVRDPPQGVAPPTQNTSKKVGHQPNKMRKFIGQWSMGLRVRLNPSLQSEQIGVIKPNGVISFIDEIHNDDGVWLRLSQDSIKKWCSGPNGYTEAWALQYNQQLGKTLLVPVEEPKSILDEIIKETILRRLPELMRDKGQQQGQQQQQRRGGPGVYQVVKCGSSGHNIRCRPNLKATPIGMLVLSNTITAVEDVYNGDGVWVKMDKETMARYCHEVEGEAWALARDNNDIVYLQHEADLITDGEQQPDRIGLFGFGPTILGGADGDVTDPCSAAGGATASGPSGAASGRGFDFSNAQQTPSFSVFGAPQAAGSFSPSPPPPTWPTFGKGDAASLPPNSNTDKAGPSSSSSGGVRNGPGLYPSPRPTPSASASSSSSNPMVSPKVPDRKDSLKDIPPELQGVSVKDLVKALGKVKLEREINKAVGKQLGQSVGERVVLDVESAAAVHSELKGVSVKDLVRLLGESRVNGNGATPPRTPPGTPKKTLSRSSSPKPVTGSPREISSRGSCSPLCPPSPSPRPREIAHVLPNCHTIISPSTLVGHNSSRTPPKTPPTARRTDSYTFSTPPQTPPTLRRDLGMNGPSPKLGSPIKRTCYSPQRSSSSSPQRSSSPLNLGARASSASPIRTPGASGLATADGGIKGHFSIGATSKDDLRLSPKSSRKDRGRSLRSKRERASSPAKDKTPTSRSRSGSLPGERVRELVKEAMSPSVAECMRAVFASFMWHEGIVHDAMACASFLKFHPNLPKEMPRIRTEATSGNIAVNSSSQQAATSGAAVGKEGRVTPSGTLKKHSRQNSEVANINEAVKAGGSGSASPVPSGAGAVGLAGIGAGGDFISTARNTTKERCYSESKASDNVSITSVGDTTGINTPSPASASSTAAASSSSTKAVLVSDKDSELPLTLQYLVYFWEELSGATLKVITQNLILPSPAVNAKNKRSEKKEKEGKEGRDKKLKKKKEVKQVVGGRGNLFGEAAGGLFGGGEKETVCELCGGMFPHPITYHMRQTHPGCGRHAGGQGYNSGGNYCGGWAGNCGDGGIGGSTWYLMCSRCREKFFREKRQALKDKSKKAKKKTTPGKPQQSVTSILEPHLVMKNNAMFLLDLASATGINLPTKDNRGKPSLRLDNVLPSVSEDSLGEHCPFPTAPFLYLVQRGAHGADSAFAEEVIFKSDEFVPSFSENHRHSGDLSNLPRVTRSDSMGGREHRRSTHLTPQEDTNPELQFAAARSAAASPESDSSSTGLGAGRAIIFQRSISEIASRGVEANESNEEGGLNINNKVVIRRRNNSGGIADGGMSLLKHPSAAMSKLIQSAEKAAGRPSPCDKALQKPVMSFVIQRHDLDSLQLAMKQALRKAACRVYALQAFNWLVRSVTQPMCLHDLLWFFVASLSPPVAEFEEEEEADGKKEKKDQEQVKVVQQEEKEQSMCEHPLSDITIAGEAVSPLPGTFHIFLQTISDVMMYLPPGSSLQQMAVRCWCLKFRPSDHIFLHKSHVFSNISKILSKSDEEWGDPPNCNDNLQQVYGCVECLKDLTPLAELKASSRQAMIVSLTDNSTETFWESGDEDRNKTKSITVNCNSQHRPKMVYVHIDNSRDLSNKVSTVVFSAGPSPDDMHKLRQVEVEARHTGWVSCPVPELLVSVIRLELKGPDNSLRLRQVKVLGEAEGVSLVISGAQYSPLVMQQKNCEAETLKVFRLLTSQVFGRLIVDEEPELDQKENKKNEGDLDLKEHMVSILFSRSKLTHLQKQVCSHIVQAIRKESQRVQDEWEATLNSKVKVDEHNRSCDAYCFELLSMVLALSGSVVGRAYLAQQHSLIQNLLSLLHTATPRVQRQVTALLRRVLPEVSPLTLANMLLVPTLPPKDYSILSNSDREHDQQHFDPNRPGILDVFLACIAKSLTVQTKVKGLAGAKGSSFRLTDCLPASARLPGRWWLRGTISTKQAESIIQLLKDMTEGNLSDAWASVTKGAIAETILALTKLDDTLRAPNECVKTPTLWLALASLCVLGQEHVERLSSGQWVGGSEPNTPRPTCDNHDDGETSAIILCSECGNLCADCDRFLHLHRRTRSHQRQVFKEEEEAIKVDLHEGCGRIKLFWLMALADSKTLKAMVEFREGNKGKVRGSAVGTCRFCGTSDNTGILAIGNVCSDPECQRHAENACTKSLPCGHPCGGISGEQRCLPCLHGCHGDQDLKQDADDMCMVCFTEALSAAPAIQLKCGHVFHFHCCKNVLAKGWVGPRITFSFSFCPICKSPIDSPALKDGLEPIKRLFDDVHRKALMRLEYEGLHKAEAITTVGARFYNDPAGYAMERYAYYVCFKCQKAYYGGEVRCEEQAVQGDQYDPAELVCGACSDVSRAQMCPKHGTDFLEYKCRYCCSVAVFFCFGTTHFCNACHDDFQRVTNIAKSDLPHCPAGPKAKQLEGDECPLHVQHPGTGEEFALGCGVCRNAHTF